MPKIYNRQTKTFYEEVEVGKKSLKFLYETSLGKIILRPLIKPFFSNWKARINDTKQSVKKIQPFVKKYGIDLTESERNSFHSFNDFFTRRLQPSARPIATAENHVIAVADSKLMVYPITNEGTFNIKDQNYTLEELVRDKSVASQFQGGDCFVYRLTLDDYHRYCYPDAGKKIGGKYLRGVLHSVRPLAHRHVRVFSENTRLWQLLQTRNFGRILFVEVGAMLVGKIHDHGHTQFIKGQEKGYFAYGGSTIVVCYEKGKIILDADILSYNHNGIEVKVHYGEKVGKYAQTATNLRE